MAVKIGIKSFPTPKAGKLEKGKPQPNLTFNFQNSTSISAGQQAITFTLTDLWTPTRDIEILCFYGSIFRIDNAATPYYLHSCRGRATILATLINPFPPRTVFTPAGGGFVFDLNNWYREINTFLSGQNPLSVRFEASWDGLSAATDSISYNLIFVVRYL